MSVDGEPKAGSSIHWNRKAVIVLIGVHKQPRFPCNCYADTITDSSLTPSVSLLVRPSGTIHSTVDSHELTELQK